MFQNQKIRNVYILLIFLFFSVNAYTTSFENEKEIDSIRFIIDQKTTDTGKFYFLYRFTQNNISPVIDFDRYAFFGRWAYNEIKNSSDKKALSYGYDLLGRIYLQEGTFDSSGIFLTRALKTRKQTGNKQDIAWSYYNLARLDLEQGNIKEALNEFGQAKINFHEIQDYYGKTSAYYWLSVVYDRMGNYDSAIVYKQLVIGMSEKYFGEVKVIQSYLDITNTYRHANDIKKCYIYFNKALDLAENIKDERQLTFVYTAIGNFFFEQKNNLTLSLEYYFQALKISKRISTEYREALLESLIGRVYLAKGKDSLALQYHLKNLEKVKELNYGYGICVAYKNLGNTYKKMGNYSLALSSYHKCLGITNFQESKIYFHEVLLELADLYMIMDNPEDALDNYLKALKLAETYHDQSRISKTELIIGDFYQKKGLLQLAEKHYEKSLESSRTARNIETIKESADNLSHLFLQKGNYTLAYNYLNIAKEATDSLSKINSQISLAELELRFEFEKLGKENEAKQQIADAEIKKQKAYRNSFLLISVLLGILGIFVFLSYKRKKKDNLKLVSQKKEIEDMSTKLHETDQMKLRFFSNISHEIRTPLTLILNPLKNLIKSFGGNPEEKRQLELILNNTNRLHELTDQILDLQKLDNGNLKLEFIEEDIVLYVKGIISSFEGYCNKTNC
ncbi:MAG: tetratricopeptide repeat protein, partial [Bacteroidales bacterium]